MQINFTDFPEVKDDQLREFARGKVERLGKFFDRIVDVDVYLKEDNDPAAPSTAGFRVNIPTDTLFAEESAETYQEALDHASRSMERQLKRWKEKHTAHLNR